MRATGFAPFARRRRGSRNAGRSGAPVLHTRGSCRQECAGAPSRPPSGIPCRSIRPGPNRWRRCRRRSSARHPLRRRNASPRRRLAGIPALECGIDVRIGTAKVQQTDPPRALGNGERSNRRLETVDGNHSYLTTTSAWATRPAASRASIICRPTVSGHETPAPTRRCRAAPVHEPRHPRRRRRGRRAAEATGIPAEGWGRCCRTAPAAGLVIASSGAGPRAPHGLDAETAPARSDSPAMRPRRDTPAGKSSAALRRSAWCQEQGTGSRSASTHSS